MEYCDRERTVTRADLIRFKRILVKVGTSTVIQPDHTAALGRVGELVEQISKLHEWGKEVILVASGSVGMGSQYFINNRRGISSNNVSGNTTRLGSPEEHIKKRVCAAMGQSRLMMLYEVMFSQKGITCSQVLVTNEDFKDLDKRSNLKWTLNNILSYGIIPVVNENDVTSILGRNDVFNDNDSLACLLAGEINADTCILLTDVDGLYTRPPVPGQPKPPVIHTFIANRTHFTIGDKSSMGRGGMGSKVNAALLALERDVPAVIIASGYSPNTITDIIRGEEVGTLFVKKKEEQSVLADVDISHNLRAKL